MERRNCMHARIHMGIAGFRAIESDLAALSLV
jgi:hypothetical protein